MKNQVYIPLRVRQRNRFLYRVGKNYGLLVVGKECTVAFMKEFLQLALENHRALFYLQIVQSAAGESENLRVTSVYREYDKDPLESSETNSRYKRRFPTSAAVLPDQLRYQPGSPTLPPRRLRMCSLALNLQECEMASFFAVLACFPPAPP